MLTISPAIFGTGACQTEVVPRSLPIFKRFIQLITKASNRNDADQIIMMVRSCLSSIMRTLEHAQIRGEAGIPCIKNTLMASTLLVTSGINVIPPNDSQLPLLCTHLMTHLPDPETSTITISCLRLLLCTSPKTATDQELIRLLLPQLVRFIASNTHPEIGNAVATVLTGGFLQVLFGEQVKVAVTLFVPMLLECARRGMKNGGEGEERGVRETARRLLECAATEREGFRNVVANLEEGQRRFAEELLKANVGGTRREERGEERGPSIELKMDFGA